MRRLLGVEPDAFPAALVAEYELRLRMFHSDGNSGPLGTLGIIDMLRSMHLGPRLVAERPKDVDWSRLPKDGSVRIEAKIPLPTAPNGEWVPGVYIGNVGVGTLAVRLIGDTYVHELERRYVRIARVEPSKAFIKPVEEAEAVPVETVPVEEAAPATVPEYWSKAQAGEPCIVEDNNDYHEGVFQKFRDGEVFVTLKGEKKARGFAPAKVVCTALQGAGI